MLAPSYPCVCVFNQSCLTLWDPRGLLPTGLLCPWDSEARTLESVAIPFSRGSTRPREWTSVSWIGRQIHRSQLPSGVRFQVSWPWQIAHTLHLFVQLQTTFCILGHLHLGNTFTDDWGLPASFLRSVAPGSPLASDNPHAETIVVWKQTAGIYLRHLAFEWVFLYLDHLPL